MKKLMLNINDNDVMCLDDECGTVLIENEFCKCCGIQIRYIEKLDYNNGRCEYCQ